MPNPREERQPWRGKLSGWRQSGNCSACGPTTDAWPDPPDRGRSVEVGVHQRRGAELDLQAVRVADVHRVLHPEVRARGTRRRRRRGAPSAPRTAPGPSRSRGAGSHRGSRGTRGARSRGSRRRRACCRCRCRRTGARCPRSRGSRRAPRAGTRAGPGRRRSSAPTSEQMKAAWWTPRARRRRPLALGADEVHPGRGSGREVGCHRRRGYRRRASGPAGRSPVACARCPTGTSRGSGTRSRPRRPSGSRSCAATTTRTYGELARRAARSRRHARRAPASGPATRSRSTCSTGRSTSRPSTPRCCLGAVPVNVNYRYGVEETRYLLADADAAAIVTEARFAPVVTDAVARLDPPPLVHRRSDRRTTPPSPPRPLAPRARARRRRPDLPLHRRHHRACPRA